MSTNPITPAHINQAVASLRTELSITLSAYRQLIQNIDTTLGMPLPEAAEPLLQSKLTVIWDLYREAIARRQINTTAQADLCERLITDLTDNKPSNLEECGALLRPMQVQLDPMQAKAKEWDAVSLFLEQKIVALAPHLEQSFNP